MRLGGIGLSFGLAASGLASTFEPPVAMRGMFSYMTDAAVFEDCVTGRRLPVAMEGDYLALERAYLSERAEPGQAILAKVEGRILDRVPMEGPARPTLVVDRFVSLSPGEACQGRIESPPFEKTYWKLTELNGSAVVPVERRGEAHLIFQAEGRLAGSDGCNRMFGSYALDGEKIEFGRTGGTLMACPEAARNREFVAALGKAATWRILGTHLELRSKDGTLLARFEAAHSR